MNLFRTTASGRALLGPGVVAELDASADGKASDNAVFFFFSR